MERIIDERSTVDICVRSWERRRLRKRWREEVFGVESVGELLLSKEQNVSSGLNQIT